MAETTAPVVAAKRTFKKTANITRALLKVVMGKEYYVRFTSDMHIGKEVAQPVKTDAAGNVLPKKAPALVAFVDNLEKQDEAGKDEENIVICSTVMSKELIEAYPNEGYVGKCFFFKQTKVEGKTYNIVELCEVEDPDPARSAAVLEAWKAQKAAKAPAETTDAETGEVTKTATTKVVKK